MAKLQEAQAPYLTLTEQAAAPASPAAGDQRLYTKTDGKLYRKNNAGTETLVGGGAGGIANQYLHLRKVGTQAIAATTWTDLTWQTEKSDSWGGFNSATSTTDITVNESGLYGVVFKPAIVSGSYNLLLSFYDVTIADDVIHGAGQVSTGYAAPAVSGIAYLDSTHTYRARIYLSAAGTINDGDFGYRTNLIVSKIKGS